MGETVARPASTGSPGRSSAASGRCPISTPPTTASVWPQASGHERRHPGFGGLDIFKLALVRLDRSLEEAKLASRLVLQVHDEVIVEVSPGEEAESQPRLHRIPRPDQCGQPPRSPSTISMASRPSWAAARAADTIGGPGRICCDGTPAGTVACAYWTHTDPGGHPCELCMTDVRTSLLSPKPWSSFDAEELHPPHHRRRRSGRMKPISNWRWAIPSSSSTMET